MRAVTGQYTWLPFVTLKRNACPPVTSQGADVRDTLSTLMSKQIHVELTENPQDTHQFVTMWALLENEINMPINNYWLVWEKKNSSSSSYSSCREWKPKKVKEDSGKKWLLNPGMLLDWTLTFCQCIVFFPRRKYFFQLLQTETTNWRLLVEGEKIIGATKREKVSRAQKM